METPSSRASRRRGEPATLPEVDKYQRADAVSRALHREVVAAIVRDPGVLRRAQERVRVWCDSAEAPSLRHYGEAWSQLLGLPLAELAELLDEDSPRMHDLRQCSPFAGSLSPQLRWRIIKRTRATP